MRAGTDYREARGASLCTFSFWNLVTVLPIILRNKQYKEKINSEAARFNIKQTWKQLARENSCAIWGIHCFLCSPHTADLCTPYVE